MYTKTIFRVEHPEDGNGPYNSVKSFRLYHDNWETYPNPHSDALDFIVGLHYCGFNDLQQLRQWFTPFELKTLHTAGFELTIYQVTDKDHVQIGKRQATFIKAKATKIISLSLGTA